MAGHGDLIIRRSIGGYKEARNQRICGKGYQVVSSFLPFRVIVAGVPYYELAKEREGTPLSLPRRSCPFFIIFPSFFVIVLTVRRGLLRIAARNAKRLDLI
jgi:hypothetical protein